MTRSATISGRAPKARVRAAAAPADLAGVFGRLAGRPGCVWLDSAGGPRRLARWSVLVAEPAAVLVTEGRTTRFIGRAGRTVLVRRGRPFDALRAALAAAPLPAETDPPLPFGPGFYGYFAYDLAPFIEPTAPLAARRDIPLPDLWFGLYDAALVVDGHQGQAFLVGAEGPAWSALEAALEAPAAPLARESPHLEGNAGEPFRRRACAARSSGKRPPRRAVKAGAPGPSWNLSRDAYLAAVERARQYIAAGDIFQVNLSRRLTVALADCGLRTRASQRSRFAASQSSIADCGLAAGESAAAGGWPALYGRLRRANPAPYAAYVGLDAGRAVLSSSPELFLDLAAGDAAGADYVVTRPIKGTRPLRPGDEAFNRRMRDDLEASPKDRAELVMIVDLERNDLGRVATYGSVRVAEPRTIEPYAAVYHTVATVEGRLHPGRDVVDLVKATFPGGSITGAPKVRAMQIIAELEPTRRSVYTGAIGYLAPPSARHPAGRCALNIAIRTLLAADDKVHVQVGGGIVADSEPEAEFQETADKARAMLAALGLRP